MINLAFCVPFRPSDFRESQSSVLNRQAVVMAVRGGLVGDRDLSTHLGPEDGSNVRIFAGSRIRNDYQALWDSFEEIDRPLVTIEAKTDSNLLASNESSKTEYDYVFPCSWVSLSQVINSDAGDINAVISPLIKFFSNIFSQANGLRYLNDCKLENIVYDAKNEKFYLTGWLKPELCDSDAYGLGVFCSPGTVALKTLEKVLFGLSAENLFEFKECTSIFDNLSLYFERLELKFSKKVSNSDLNREFKQLLDLLKEVVLNNKLSETKIVCSLNEGGICYSELGHKLEDDLSFEDAYCIGSGEDHLVFKSKKNNSKVLKYLNPEIFIKDDAVVTPSVYLQLSQLVSESLMMLSDVLGTGEQLTVLPIDVYSLPKSYIEKHGLHKSKFVVEQDFCETKEPRRWSSRLPIFIELLKKSVFYSMVSEASDNREFQKLFEEILYEGIDQNADNFKGDYCIDPVHFNCDLRSLSQVLDSWPSLVEFTLFFRQKLASLKLIFQEAHSYIDSQIQSQDLNSPAVKSNFFENANEEVKEAIKEAIKTIDLRSNHSRPYEGPPKRPDKNKRSALASTEPNKRCKLF